MRVGPIIGAALLLAGCAGAGQAPLPLAATGPVDVVVAGQAFIADLQPGPVLTVTREPVFGFDEGKLAKDVAQAFCASRDSRLQAQALGRFAGGAWVFEGGCA